MNGVLNLYKPTGISSFGAIRRVQKIFGEKKIGHLGTLDPMAEGVLPLFLGKATKLIPYLNQGDKSYEAEVTLGVTSPTLDREGELTACPIPDDLTEARIKEALMAFQGEIEQIPPMYSAIKKDGKKLYELARQGLEIEREPRKVTLHEIELLEVKLPCLRFHVHCSKGTYIRTLADDLGKSLGTGAILSGLIRTSCQGGFPLSSAVRLDQMENLDHTSLLQLLLEPTLLFPDWAQFEIHREEDLAWLGQGRRIPLEAQASGYQAGQKALLKGGKEILAMGHLEFSQADLFFQPKKVLI